MLDIRVGPESTYVSELTRVGDRLFFLADDGVVGHELWRSDGTPAGTMLVRDIEPGSVSSFARRLTALGDTLC